MAGYASSLLVLSITKSDVSEGKVRESMKHCNKPQTNFKARLKMKMSNKI